MRLAIIGRSEILFNTAQLLKRNGYEIALIITSKEAPEYKVGADDFRNFAKECGAKFFQTSKIGDLSLQIENLKPLDLAISFNYPTIIPQDIIDMFFIGMLNAHGGDLPKYRGNACQAWAIINGEKKIGLCVHFMIGGEIDSGNIVTRDSLKIDINTKITQVWDWMKSRTPTLFLEALQNLEKDPSFILEVQSKEPSAALRCYPRKPEDGRINWSNSAENILRLINACNKPFAGAYCNYNGEKMIIWEAGLGDSENFLAIPGQVSSINGQHVEILTGKGKLKIFKVEVSGTEKNPSDIIKSTRDRLV